jgi:Transglutaminase-like superfamily
MKRIHKYLQLSWSDRLLLVQSTFVLAMVVLGLKAFPWSTLHRFLPKLANWLSRFMPANRPPAQQIAWAIRVASWIVPGATCLPNALAAQFLLIRFAYPTDFQIGVARNRYGKLEAHAWVTTEKNIIIGGVSDLDHFVPMSPLDKHGLEDYGRAH